MHLPTLPYDILEKIASFADIDTRRYMGFKPNPLSPIIQQNMEKLIRKKYLSRYYHCDSNKIKTISTAILISRNPTMESKVCYIAYDIETDTTNFTFYDGCMYFSISHLQTVVLFNKTVGLIRGDMTTINRDYIIRKYNSISLSTRISAYNSLLLS
jgi:hypothetical protein